MTFLERLQAHRGGLIRLKTNLYWYGGRGWDGNPGSICIILESANPDRGGTPSTTVAITASGDGGAPELGAGALLLIDGRPQWVWVVEQDVEIIDEAR